MKRITLLQIFSVYLIIGFSFLALAFWENYINNLDKGCRSFNASSQSTGYQCKGYRLFSN